MVRLTMTEKGRRAYNQSRCPRKSVQRCLLCLKKNASNCGRAWRHYVARRSSRLERTPRRCHSQSFSEGRGTLVSRHFTLTLPSGRNPNFKSLNVLNLQTLNLFSILCSGLRIFSWGRGKEATLGLAFCMR